MRTLILIALLAASVSLHAAQSPQYKFAFALRVGESPPVVVSAAVPPGTSHKLQATEHLKFEVEAPATLDERSVTVVRLIDQSSGKPVLLATSMRGGPVTRERESTFTVCSTRVIFQSPSPSQPASCADLPPMAPAEPIVGGPCGDCAGPFEGMPESFTSRARIAPIGEPGEPMVVTGRVLGADGKPRPNIIVYAYHTDEHGIYPEPNPPRSMVSNHHGRLRGWALTDARGRYTFDTIRPANYPNTDQPAHIHMHVVERGCATYYIDEVLFTNDPMLTPEKRARIVQGRGGDGVVTPRRSGPGKAWQVTRDIHLGENIPEYPGCAGRLDAG